MTMSGAEAPRREDPKDTVVRRRRKTPEGDLRRFYEDSEAESVVRAREGAEYSMNYKENRCGGGLVLRSLLL